MMMAKTEMTTLESERRSIISVTAEKAGILSGATGATSGLVDRKGGGAVAVD